MSQSPDDELLIVDAPERQRYEALLESRVVGFTEYRVVRDNRVILLHTEVDPIVSGQGIGGRLAAGALDDIRARGLTATVKCPFISTWLQRHPEYEDILTG
jgi:uncharacterized protein